MKLLKTIMAIFIISLLIGCTPIDPQTKDPTDPNLKTDPVDPNKQNQQTDPIQFEGIQKFESGKEVLEYFKEENPDFEEKVQEILIMVDLVWWRWKNLYVR